MSDLIITVDCDQCGGTGELVDCSKDDGSHRFCDERECPTCRGTGSVIDIEPEEPQ